MQNLCILVMLLHVHRLDLVLSYLLLSCLHSSNYYIFLNCLSPLLSNNMFILPMLLLASMSLSLMFHLLLSFRMYYYYISGFRNLIMSSIIQCFMLSNSMLVLYHLLVSLHSIRLVFLVLLYLCYLSELTFHNLSFMHYLLLGNIYIFHYHSPHLMWYYFNLYMLLHSPNSSYSHHMLHFLSLHISLHLLMLSHLLSSL